MPMRDGTGPAGRGPQTGRGGGHCRRQGQTGAAAPAGRPEDCAPGIRGGRALRPGGGRRFGRGRGGNPQVQT